MTVTIEEIVSSGEKKEKRKKGKNRKGREREKGGERKTREKEEKYE